MSVKELINQIDDKKAVDAQSTFASVMQDKLADAIETRKREVANTFVKTPVRDEEEDVPEDV